MGSKQVLFLLMCALAVKANSIHDQELTKDTVDVPADNGNSTHIADTGNLADLATIVGNSTRLESSTNLVQVVENNLYNAVVSRKYDDAVIQTKRIYEKGYCSIIWTVVNRLIDEEIPEVFDYAYKIIATDARNWRICRDCLPTPIRVNENHIFVKIINYKYGMALKYGRHEDLDGDRDVYGNSNTETRFEVTWKFVPNWYGDRVYFKVRPSNLDVFLKLGNSRDYDGDHGAYGSHNHDTDRHLWYLKPTRHNGKILFFIINREYNEPLKLGKSTDEEGERKAYGNSNLYSDPDRFGWELQVL